MLWWAWPLPDPFGGLLALAADARPLRTAGPRLALGERLLPFAAAPPARGGFHRLGAALTPPGRLRAGLLSADRLAGLLPAGSADRRALLLDVLDQAGLPALRLDPATVLPVLPADPQAAAAHAAAGLGRRYPTAQQRAARVGPPPQPEQSAPPARTVRGGRPARCRPSARPPSGPRPPSRPAPPAPRQASHRPPRPRPPPPRPPRPRPEEEPPSSRPPPNRPPTAVHPAAPAGPLPPPPAPRAPSPGG